MKVVGGTLGGSQRPERPAAFCRGTLTPPHLQLPYTPPPSPNNPPIDQIRPHAVSASFSDAILGGHHVELIRTKDFKTWQRSPNAPFIQPSPMDGTVSEFAGFPAIAAGRALPFARALPLPSSIRLPSSTTFFSKTTFFHYLL